MKRASVIIIGTSHELQAGQEDAYNTKQREAFKKLIEATTLKYRIRFIAEEMCEDVLESQYKVSATIAKRIADSNPDIDHQYVELTDQIRRNLKIDRHSVCLAAKCADLTEEQYKFLDRIVGELRECIWLVRVLNVRKWPTLLICGANHVRRIQELFASIGKLAEIEVNDFQPPNLDEE